MKIEDVLNLARQNIRALTPYQSARAIHSGGAVDVFLDANENPRIPFPGAGPVNRYMEQQPDELMGHLSRLYDVPQDMILCTRGGDEAIDLVIRAFCEAGQDNIIICPPTFPVYEIAASVQGAQTIRIPLKDNFQMDVDQILQQKNDYTKVIFVCSPNNPTANLMDESDVIKICEQSCTLVFLDEAYIEFSGHDSFISKLDQYPNLVVMRTLSKCYALAGARCGAIIAHPELISLVRKVMAVYPVSQPVNDIVCKALQPANLERLSRFVASLVEQRQYLEDMLQQSDDVVRVYSSDTNFLLVEVKDAKAFSDKCLKAGILVRSQDSVIKNHVRFSIGDFHENQRLLSVLGVDAVNKEDLSCRQAFLSRETKETKIYGFVDLDEEGLIHIDTGIAFYDHMLEQIASHGRFSLVLSCKGDLEVDEHHSMEDCAIVLGALIKKALGDKAGIARFGFTAPMDEALARISLDLSGRAFLKFDGDFPRQGVGEMPTEMVSHVFRSFAESLAATLHVEVSGDNTHHMIEACFKGLGRALCMAIHKEGDALPSTKGVL